jgi:CRP-like cAMP-binding protein
MSVRVDFSNLIRHATEVEARKAGETIFRAGDPGRHMYVVKTGEVEIRVEDKIVETVGAGGVFGEMALADDAPRSATAVARRDSEIVPIDERQFLFLVQQTPFFALGLLRVLASRLRTMNRLY